MSMINLYEAKTQLSKLVDRAAAGEDIVIARNGRPVAQLIPWQPNRKPRELGLLKGQIAIADDFDAPLPDDVLEAFER